MTKRKREGEKVGLVGLGAMGTPVAHNLLSAGYKVVAFDINKTALDAVVSAGAEAAASPRAVAEACDNVITIVPNDAVLRKVVNDADTGLLAALRGVHISCSTVHPDTAREIAALHAASPLKAGYVGAPVFARADGIARRQASFVVGGKPEHVATARPILECNSNGIFEFGEDAGAGNVVKLCGNFMIACAIQSSAEALSLAEKSGVDRVKVMDMLSSTIFDCLIYKGYGMRTAKRQHTPGQPLVGPGFQLDLGLKDVTLAQDVAHKVQAPMPFASVLHDRFLAAQAKGRGKMDWSAVALSASEEAGIDVSQWLSPNTDGEGEGEGEGK